ncbi:hypothetical protein BV898_02205 [Hypsibius exemplaris]|uniref:Uncharacterized protein n=1 Tax=Hypsibius exemplaris TaxID=2072580 RepID=A0A1W0X8I7_HYPEX|nr:hypothetical protein BV898_02205 [Hypsibius exemplaris]
MDEGNFCRLLVDQLRSELDLPYEQCVSACSILLQELLQLMRTTGLNHIEASTLRKIQQKISASQETMNKKQALDSWDFSALTALIGDLEHYRKGSGNRESCWPGGSFPNNKPPGESGGSAGSGESGGGAGSGSAEIVSLLHNAFKKVNPMILQHVAAFPGAGSPDEFKLIDVLADEFQWMLQKSESTPGSVAGDSLLADLCGILLRAIVTHPQALSVIAHNTTIRSMLFRIIRSAVEQRRCNGSLDSDLVLSKLIKLATAVLSFLADDVELISTLSSGTTLDEAFPELSTALRDHVNFVSSHPHARSKDSLIALLSAASFLARPCKYNAMDGQQQDEDGYGTFFCDLWNEVTACGQNDLASYLAQTVLEWWNYQGSAASGTHSSLEGDFGLRNECNLVGSFLKDLVVVRARPLFCESNVGSTLEYFPSSVAAVKEATSSDAEFFLISDGDCELLIGMCERMGSNCEPGDKTFQAASSLATVIRKIRRPLVEDN